MRLEDIKTNIEMEMEIENSNDMLMRQWVDGHKKLQLLPPVVHIGDQLQMKIGGDSSDVKLDTPTTQQLTRVTDIMEPYSSIFQLGKLMVELEDQISILTSIKEKLEESFTQNVDGHHGQNVVESWG